MIDPRPYTYQYRKPRLSNPTYRSSNMYDSLYHLRFPTKNEFILPRQNNKNKQQQFKLPVKDSARNNNNPQRYQSKIIQNRNQQPVISRQQSLDLRDRYQSQKSTKNYSINKDFTERSNHNNYNLPNNQNLQNGVSSHLSNYGQNLMKSSNFNRFQIYQKQQKGFNIINCQPKQMSNSLRVFPKLTMQDKLIEKGRYGPK